jgi:hypothetical protein
MRRLVTLKRLKRIAIMYGYNVEYKLFQQAGAAPLAVMES